MKCDTKIVQTICSESATDAVAKLVASGMKVVPACKLTAEEYNAQHPDSEAVKWQALKLTYYRANKCINDTVSKKTSKIKDIPVVDNSTMTIKSLKVELKQAQERIKELESTPSTTLTTSQFKTKLASKDRQLREANAKVTEAHRIMTELDAENHRLKNQKVPNNQTKEEFVEEYQQKKTKEVADFRKKLEDSEQ